jgi:hypothetical protein
MKHIKIRGELTEDLLGVRIYVEEQAHLGSDFGIKGSSDFKTRSITLRSFSNRVDEDWVASGDDSFFYREDGRLYAMYLKGISSDRDTPDGRVLSAEEWVQLKEAVIEYNEHFAQE